MIKDIIILTIAVICSLPFVGLLLGWELFGYEIIKEIWTMNPTWLTSGKILLSSGIALLMAAPIMYIIIWIDEERGKE